MTDFEAECSSARKERGEASKEGVMQAVQAIVQGLLDFLRAAMGQIPAPERPLLLVLVMAFSVLAFALYVILRIATRAT